MRRRSMTALLALTALAVTPAAADAARSGTYKGRTAQGNAMSFTVSQNTVRNFRAGMTTYCESRFDSDAIAGVRAMRVRRDGTFGLLRTGRVSIRIRGRFRGRTATGTLTLRRPDGSDDCSAVNVKFTVRRR